MALPVAGAGHAANHQQQQDDFDDAAIGARGPPIGCVLVLVAIRRGWRWRARPGALRQAGMLVGMLGGVRRVVKPRGRRRLFERLASGRLKIRLGRAIDLAVRRPFTRHRIIGGARRTIGLRRRIAEALRLGHAIAEVAQAMVTKTLVAQRRPRLLAIGGIRPRAFCRFRFHLADRLLQRQPLARDVGFIERGIDAAQLGDQRAARALVQRTAVLAGVLVEAGDGAGDQGKIVSHCASFV